MPSRTIRAFFLLAASASYAAAQTTDDALVLPRRTAATGVMYARDSWDHYWEGTLARTNGNIGTLTTQSVTWMAGYGLTDRVTVMAALPYVWTHASQGVMADARGVQDLSLAAKYRLFTTTSSRGAFSGFVVGVGSVPMSDYTPDYYPFSIGSHGGRATARLNLGYQSSSTWFAHTSAGYTFCSNVKLDRNSYYTNGQLYLTNEVAMPNVFDYSVTAGINRGRWRVPVGLVQQVTLGGGDIRRQDMPFVSNRMNFVKLDGAVMYALPQDISIRLGAAHVLAGRNVGESTTLTSGVMYALHF